MIIIILTIISNKGQYRKRKIGEIIIPLRPSKKFKDKKTVNEKQLALKSVVMKSSALFLRYCDIGLHVIFSNTPVPQEPKRNIITVLGNNGISSDMRTRK